jgi:hypothetical protein
MTACLSDLRLDEILAGKRADDHLAGCAACQARAGALAADRDRFRAARPTLARPRPRIWAALAVAALAAGFAVALIPRRDEPGTRTKGGAHLGFAVAHGGAQRLGATGEVVHPGDTLSYLVTTAAPAYVTVLGEDAAGRVTVYVAAERVPAGRDLPLAVATRLDAALGREALIAVFCPTPVVVARDAPAGCTVDRLSLDKVADQP